MEFEARLIPETLIGGFRCRLTYEQLNEFHEYAAQIQEYRDYWILLAKLKGAQAVNDK